MRPRLPKPDLLHAARLAFYRSTPHRTPVACRYGQTPKAAKSRHRVWRTDETWKVLVHQNGRLLIHLLASTDKTEANQTDKIISDQEEKK